MGKNKIYSVHWLVVALLLNIAAQHSSADNHASSDPIGDAQQANETLDAFHRAAADADFDVYFALFSEDAVFLGTDASERWPVEEFKAYAKPHFDKGRGWVYVPAERHIVINDHIAWFDELLDSQSYGVSRGSGVLVKVEGHWKIAQYNLHFPIPNDLVDDITDKIKQFRMK
ncbi:MAG: nuclear transport factor 2 family protein [Pseudomonadota bacterium]